MATSSSSSVCARFDRFQVDLSSGDLRTPEATSVRIQQQPLQVLRLLLAAEGRVVTREQLRVALWPDDTFVDFEHGVNTAVKKLRQALVDSVENPKFVETLPRGKRSPEHGREKAGICTYRGKLISTAVMFIRHRQRSASREITL